MHCLLQVITLHLMYHNIIVEGIREFGPVYATWMFPFECFNSWICKRVLNRALPESTIMETYKVKFNKRKRNTDLFILLSHCILNPTDP